MRGVQMNIIMYIIVGLVAGWVVTELAPPEKHHHFFANAIIGIIGSMLGGYMFEILGLTNFSLWQGIGTAMLGAAVFLVAVKTLSRPQNNSSM